MIDRHFYIFRAAEERRAASIIFKFEYSNAIHLEGASPHVFWSRFRSKPSSRKAPLRMEKPNE